MTAPGLLNHAVRTYGWGFLPKHVLPPLIANIGVGAVLYTSYLQVLSTLHKPSSQSLKKIFPPPPIHCTFLAGFSAGAIQSVVAAPLDAVSVRFRTNEILNGRYKTMWQYGRKKLQEIGPRGVFAGWGLSFVKDSLGYAAFFASFEYVKAQAYYKFVAYYYGESWDQTSTRFLRPRLDKTGSVDVLRPHYCIEPFFLGLAGITAALSQQSIQHPLDLIQGVHYRSIGFLDKQAKIERPKSAMLRAYLSAYRKTYQQCLVQARRSNGWRRWLYKGFLWNSVKQVPASSLALVIFELVRRRYSDEAEAVRIKHEGFDILL
ncbi:hypothetical protein ACLMJK_002033 [Lecanora helva]